MNDNFATHETSPATEAPDTAPPPLPPATIRQRALPFVITAGVLILDQFSKYVIEATIPLYHSWAPIPELDFIFRITHATNTGAAFGLFPDGSLLFTVIAIIISAAIIYYNYTIPSGQHALRVALGLQLGGALGNLIDRFRLGHVTDFLDFGPWPIFNVADTAIVTGVVILGWLMLQEQQEMAPSRATVESDASTQTDYLANDSGETSGI